MITLGQLRRASRAALQAGVVRSRLTESHNVIQQQLLPATGLQANKVQGAKKNLRNSLSTGQYGVAPIHAALDHKSSHAQ